MKPEPNHSLQRLLGVSIHRGVRALVFPVAFCEVGPELGALSVGPRSIRRRFRPRLSLVSFPIRFRFAFPECVQPPGHQLLFGHVTGRGGRLAGLEMAGLPVGLPGNAGMRKLVGGEGFEPPTNCV